MHAAGQRRYIGVDVGGTKILGVSVDPSTGEIYRSTRVPTPRHETDNVADAIASVVAELLDDGQTTAIGVGVPGLVDHQGVLRYGPNVPGVLNLDIAADLRRRFGLPVVAENDASNAALAEHRLGAARGA